MTIHVKAGKVRLHLWFPTGILKSRLAFNIAKRSIKEHVSKQGQSHSMPTEQSGVQQEDQKVAVANTKVQIEQNTQTNSNSFTREQMLELYKVLKRFVKSNGHFNLVEVNSHNGEKVRIRV